MAGFLRGMESVRQEMTRHAGYFMNQHLLEDLTPWLEGENRVIGVTTVNQNQRYGIKAVNQSYRPKEIQPLLERTNKREQQNKYLNLSVLFSFLFSGAGEQGNLNDALCSGVVF